MFLAGGDVTDCADHGCTVSFYVREKMPNIEQFVWTDVSTLGGHVIKGCEVLHGNYVGLIQSNSGDGYKER